MIRGPLHSAQAATDGTGNALPVGTSTDWIELLGLIAACSRKLRCMLSDHLRAQPLNETGFWVLWICHTSETDEGISQNELAQQVGASAGHMSQVVERLRVQGWLHGHRSPQDRRRQCWRITSAGREALSATVRHLEGKLGSACPSFPNPQRQALRGLLTELLDSLAVQPAGLAPTPAGTAAHNSVPTAHNAAPSVSSSTVARAASVATSTARAAAQRSEEGRP